MNAVEQGDAGEPERAGGQEAERIDPHAFPEPAAGQQGIDQKDGDHAEDGPEHEVEDFFDAVVHVGPMPVRFLKPYAPRGKDMTAHMYIFSSAAYTLIKNEKGERVCSRFSASAAVPRRTIRN